MSTTSSTVLYAAPRKNHSLNRSPGPRPLQLVRDNIVQDNAPATAPLASTYSVLPSPVSPGQFSLPSGSRKHPTSRRQSSISYYPSNREQDSPLRSAAASTSSLGRSRSVAEAAVSCLKGTDSPRGPLTLAEKHADLLHFIAQKESKCLELRSQLAKEEEELCDLKRKWERIVNRGFQRTNGPAPIIPPNSSAGLGGLQGVGRMLVAGLNDLHSPSSPSYTSGHANSQSTSSASTNYTTTSTNRFSLSSASSMSFGSDESPHEEEGVASMVSHSSCVAAAEVNRETQPGMNGDVSSSRMHRRKSRDYTTPPPLADSESVKATSKRSSLSAPNSLPPASIPGMVTLSSQPGVSSWVGNVGKKWEEIQRGDAFVKSQKRASVLFNDMSESILAALASPSPKTAPLAFLGESPGSSTTTTVTGSRSTVSLLDDDDDVLGEQTLVMASVMTPDSKGSVTVSGKVSVGQDDDEEWNW